MPHTVSGISTCAGNTHWPFHSPNVSLILHSLHRTAGAGYIGQITANSFMKREFGKKLIEEFLSQIDLTHVIDTSGA